MYCPRCASTSIEGQRFCRSCGMNLGVILDALEGKRGPLDFETLKRDLRELGSNLRTGFEEAGIAIKRTSRLDKGQAQPPAPIAMAPPNWTKEFNRALKKVKAANTRKYSLQQATLSIFGGGAMMAAWYYILNATANSGLVSSIEQVILRETGHPITGIADVVRILWMLALIPIVTGVAHLFNGIFLAPKALEESREEAPPAFNYVAPVSAIPPAGNTTSDLNPTPSSITEDSTIRLENS